MTSSLCEVADFSRKQASKSKTSTAKIGCR